MEPIVSFSIIFLLMVGAVFLSSLLRTSYVLGYILAGFLYGQLFHFHREAIEFIFETAVLLLFFFLGLEFSLRKLRPIFSSIMRVSITDFILNFSIGFAAGYLMTGSLYHAILIGAIFYPSSSIVIVKLLELRHRFSNIEAPIIVGTLIFEDIVMILLIGVIVAFGPQILLKLAIILTAIALAFIANIKLRPHLEKLIRSIEGHTVEAKTISFLFLIFSLSALFKKMDITASLGAFLVGVVFSDISERSFEESLGNLKDIFLALFFFFFGYELSHIHFSLSVLVPASILLLLSIASKVSVFYLSGLKRKTRLRAGFTMVPRGEFSILLSHYIQMEEVRGTLLLFVVMNIFLGTFMADNASRLASLLDGLLSRLSGMRRGTSA